ncbi:MAG: (2Fe-2S)-binding protein [Burkholderiales bacterium]|nr:(2Fe-2S)-binding protein [Burkholderiales bacterium]
MPTLSLRLNGRPVNAEVETSTLLVDLLRQQLGLTGTHIGCDTGQCGCCTVLVDGLAVKSCCQLALQAAGREVTTVEGLAVDGRLHPVQDAFVECHGLQCGYCTPGMVMSTVALLEHNPRPNEAEIVDALEGNLCRCTGYVNIVAAVQKAARTMAGAA